MRLDGMTKKEVASALEISDLGRLKIWMRKYRQFGEEGLIDRRRRPEDNQVLPVNEGSE
ncbi:helix-turn-helix domain-containing protein [Paenibacillus sp. DMB20]|uniref:helix-turn-helix domain-containing protein n=1 Tax=Paenibacillus sp. DMB20 TaxID=1642570 RepID=UPI000AA8F875|nr:helix-turn-helix domain-containing protein [Paenibacillus sp. DMB20]